MSLKPPDTTASKVDHSWGSERNTDPDQMLVMRVNWVLGSQELRSRCLGGRGIERVLQEFLSSNAWQCVYRVFECGKREQTTEVVGDTSGEDDKRSDGNGQAIHRTEK